MLQAVIGIFGFITPGLVIRAYGSEVNGLASSINQVLRYVSLMEVGLSGAALYALYRPLSQADYLSVNEILSYVSRFYRRTGVLFGLVVVVGAPLYARFLVHGDLSGNLVAGMFLVVGCSGALDFFVMSRCRVILTADEKGYMISLVSAIGIVVQQSLAIALILLDSPVLLVYATAIPVTLGRGLVLNHVVARVYGDRISFHGRRSSGLRRIPLQRSVFTHEVAFTVNQASPIVALGLFHGLGVASVFAVYSMPLVMISSALATFHQSVTPSFGRVAAQGDVTRTSKAFRSFQYWYMMLSAWLLSCTAILLTPFVYRYTLGINDVNYMWPEMGYMLIGLAAANTLRVVYAIAVSSFGLFRDSSPWALATSLLGVLITFSVGRFYPPFVVLGSVIAVTLNAVIQLVILHRVVPKLEAGIGVISFATLLACVSLAVLTSRWMDYRPRTWPNFFGMGGIVSMIVLILTAGVFSLLEMRRVRLHVAYLERAVSPRKGGVGMRFVVFRGHFDYSRQMCRDLESDSDVMVMSPLPSLLFRVVARLGGARLFPALIERGSRNALGRRIRRIPIPDGEAVTFCFFDSAPFALDAGFLSWLRESYPSCKLVSIIYNVIENEQRGEFFQQYYDLNFTFDSGDARRFGFDHFVGMYSTGSIRAHAEEYDLVFVGVDKGRLDLLRSIFERMNSQGVRCMFHVVSDRHDVSSVEGFVVSERRMGYEDSLDLLAASNCILDVAQPSQAGYSLRFIQSVVHGRRLLTNLPNVAESAYFKAGFMRIFDSVDEIDSCFVMNRDPVDFGYVDEFAPRRLLASISSRLGNELKGGHQNDR